MKHRGLYLLASYHYNTTSATLIAATAEISAAVVASLTMQCWRHASPDRAALGLRPFPRPSRLATCPLRRRCPWTYPRPPPLQAPEGPNFSTALAPPSLEDKINGMCCGGCRCRLPVDTTAQDKTRKMRQGQMRQKPEHLRLATCDF